MKPEAWIPLTALFVTIKGLIETRTRELVVPGYMMPGTRLKDRGIHSSSAGALSRTVFC